MTIPDIRMTQWKHIIFVRRQVLVWVVNIIYRSAYYLHTYNTYTVHKLHTYTIYINTLDTYLLAWTMCLEILTKIDCCWVVFELLLYMDMRIVSPLLLMSIVRTERSVHRMGSHIIISLCVFCDGAQNRKMLAECRTSRIRCVP